MPFKPNYSQQRAERARLKQSKKEAKVRERADAAARRKAEQDGSAESQDAPPGGDEPQES
ncbi:MAG: hypothetical protein JO157_15145 [Acetobacteraceae bacterium]|nr:hypothetical protein [Acetobacteraceae bacterium]